jgi:nitronate monooxygenase
MTLQALVGVELPIIQAPMAGVQGSALAVAVSNAGGLGSLPAALLSPEALRREAQAPTPEMAVTPPSIRKSAPTTYAESSDAR